MLRTTIKIRNKVRHKKEIYDLFNEALDEDDLLKEYRMYCSGLFLINTKGEYIAKAEEQEKIVVEALEKAWDYTFGVFEKDGIHCISQLEEDFAYDLREWYLIAMDRFWCAEEWDLVIAFNQKVLSIEWAETRDVTVTGIANQEIAEAHGKKGDLHKAEVLYENYIENANDNGEVWSNYLIFLAHNDPSKLTEKMDELKKKLSDHTVQIDDFWIEEVIHEFRTMTPTPDYGFLQDISGKKV